MADWPTSLSMPVVGAVHTASLACPVSDGVAIRGDFFSAGTTWPSANLAIYLPFLIEKTVTAYQMSFVVTTQAGNCDVGIYDYLRNRLVSKGSTAVAVAGIQIIDIADTTLTPGTYYMAMCVDTVAAAFGAATSPIVAALRTLGMQVQAVGSVTLPNPATFANPTSAYIPGLSIALTATM